MAPSRARLQSPLGLGVLAVLVLLGFQKTYKFLTAGTASSPTTTSGDPIGDIVNIIDEIYTIFANMTYIAHSSDKPYIIIDRGPHSINESAVTKHRDPRVLELMKRLPYFDKSLIDNTNWLFGGMFVDYRKQDELENSWDPLGAGGGYMKSTAVGLTGIGNGPCVLLYDVESNKVRLFDRNEWVVRDLDGKVVGSKSGKDASKTNSDAFAKFPAFDAVPFLNEVARRYRELKWTPWETQGVDDDNLDPKEIKSLLKKNGWPDKFNADMFNADFIRLKNKPSGKGYAEYEFKRFLALDGTPPEKHGLVYHSEVRVASALSAFEEAKDDDEKWFQAWILQKAKWDLEQNKMDLEEAKGEVERLCTEGVCVKEEDLILWEFRSVERTYNELERLIQEETQAIGLAMAQAQMRGDNLDDVTQPLEATLTKLGRDLVWTMLAYSQSKYEAEKHCRFSGCELLPSDTKELRAEEGIRLARKDIAHSEDMLKRMQDWKETLPINAERARIAVDQEQGRIAQGMRNMEELIDANELGWLNRGEVL